MGSSIKYIRKIFRKTTISNPLIRTRTVRIRGLEILVFRKILRTYLMDDPYARITSHPVSLYYPINILYPKYTFYLIIIYHHFSYKYRKNIYYAVTILHPKYTYYSKFAYYPIIICNPFSNKYPKSLYYPIAILHPKYTYYPKFEYYPIIIYHPFSQYRVLYNGLVVLY